MKVSESNDSSSSSIHLQRQSASIARAATQSHPPYQPTWMANSRSPSRRQLVPLRIALVASNPHIQT